MSVIDKPDLTTEQLIIAATIAEGDARREAVIPAECVPPQSRIRMTEVEAAAWRPWITGWADDILPYYDALVRELPPKARVVEVGVSHGRSLVFLAERLFEAGRSDVELWGIDFWPGAEVRKIRETLGRYAALDQDDHDSRMPHASVADFPRLVRCEGAHGARLFAEDSVDAVFIDSDHTEKGMLEHLDAWMTPVKPGGILAGHDYSQADWPGVVAAVDTFFAEGTVAHPTRSVWEYRVPR